MFHIHVDHLQCKNTRAKVPQGCPQQEMPQGFK